MLTIYGIIVSALALSTTRKSANGSKREDVCVTPECIRVASHILNYIDESVSPCDDFYNFACGNFVKNTVMPDKDERNKTDVYALAEDHVNERFRILLNEKTDPNDWEHNNMAKDFYKTCMNTTLIEEQGIAQLLEILEEFGGWPVIKGDEWDSNNNDWDLNKMIKQLGKSGFSASLFAVSIYSFTLITTGIFVSVNVLTYLKLMKKTFKTQIEISRISILLFSSYSNE